MDFLSDFLNAYRDSTAGYFIIPLFIFCARIFDVSLGTIRIILVGKGYRLWAALLGFFEVFVWIMAIGQIMLNLTNFLNYIAYASGFAMGTYLGMVLENKLSIGQMLIRVITKYDASNLLEHLRSTTFHVTALDAEGNFGSVKVIFILLERHDLKSAIKMINTFNPNAVYTVSDVRQVSEGAFPKDHHNAFEKLLLFRKSLTTRK